MCASRWLVLVIGLLWAEAALALTFDTPAVLAKLGLADVQARLATPAEFSRPAVELQFGLSHYPSVLLEVGKVFTASDWSAFDGLRLDLYNPKDHRVRVYFRFDTLDEAQKEHWFTWSCLILPRRAARIVWYTRWSSEGMRNPPLSGTGFLFKQFFGPAPNWKAVKRVIIYLDSPKRKERLYLRSATLLAPEQSPFMVDEFGQFTRAEGEYKVTSVAQLRAQAEEESKHLADFVRPDYLDRYGGWAKGPKLEATGFFRTVQHYGRWWFVDPEGHLFWSLGVDVISFGDTATPTKSRENLFEFLPSPDDPEFGPARTEGWGAPERISYYVANLIRKYGRANYRKRWEETTLDRLVSWGFNTIGNWSDWALFARRQVPYVMGLATPQGCPRLANGLPDPYDPAFEKALDAAFKGALEGHKDDPWLLGYFVDNELPWASWRPAGKLDLAKNVLQAPEKTFARRALFRFLQARYPDSAGLQAAWGEKYTSLEQLSQSPPEDLAALPDQAKADLREFQRAFAEQYFRTVNQVLKRYDPNHLYLGSRFASYCDEAVAAAGKYCDVVSFNRYDYQIDEREFARLYELAHKPFLGGEFHFGALDSGLFSGGLRPVLSQADRGRAYAHYVGVAATLPEWIGVHWFEYIDQPLTGRFDGENFNIGLVDVTDTPYQPLIEAAKAVNFAIYRIATGQQAPPPGVEGNE